MQLHKLRCGAVGTVIMTFSFVFWYQISMHIATVNPVSKLDFQQGSKRTTPLCRNILENLTSGSWVVTSQRESLTLDYESDLIRYWKKRGIQTKRWRDDGKCGFKNLQVNKPANSTWPDVGSWCDLYGNFPCCSDLEDGVCSPPSWETCNCRRCVDTRKYHFAEVSTWTTKDSRCRWTNHSAAEACDVIHRSPYDDLYFVGDSFMRNMFVTFMMLLSNDPYSGAWSIDSSTKLRQLCHDQGMYFWKECRQLIDSMSKVLNQGRLCDGRHPNFKVTMKPFYNLKFARNFYKLINSLLGRKGALVVVSVGFHMECSVENTIDGYLGPVVDLIERNQPQNDSWPKLIFVLPMLTGLLKPPAYFRFQNDDKINAFSSRMTNYCNHHRIPVLDFRQLGKYIHSFDGTHYGLTVNLMKNQILLNYIASIS